MRWCSRRNGSTSGILGFELGSDGSGAELLEVAAAGHSTEPAATPYVHMDGAQVYKFATTVSVDSATRALTAAGLTVADVDVFVPHQANRRIIDHAARRLGLTEDRVVSNVDRYGNTSAASIPICLDEAHRAGRIKAGRHRAHDGLRRRPLVGLVRDGMDTPSEGDEMNKVAFCFPGQGSQRVGMGREMARAFPEAGEVFDEASTEVDFDLRKVCFDGPDRAALRDGHHPAGARHGVARGAPRGPGPAGVKPDVVIGHSVGEYAAIAAADSVDVGLVTRLVRERGLAMAASRAKGAMAAVLGLADEEVERLCAETGDVWPANYNCPGQLVISGREGGVAARRREGARAGREGRPAARLRRVSQPARRGCGAAPRAGHPRPPTSAS